VLTKAAMPLSGLRTDPALDLMWVVFRLSAFGILASRSRHGSSLLKTDIFCSYFGLW